MGGTMETLPKIILGIPGHWKSRDEFKEALTRNGNGYIYMGSHIGCLENPGEFYEVDISDYNPYITEAIEVGGHGLFSKEDINQLKTHNSVIYLIGDGGSIDKVLKIMDVASALLNAGGIAVNVESSGRARTKEDWLDITKSKEISRVFTAFIQMSRTENAYYTTGMHCFGFCDVITSTEGITEMEVANLFKLFCLYILEENPKINDGQTFSLDLNSPFYLLKQGKCTMFEEDDPFFNPYGVWHMLRQHRPKN